MLVRVCAIFFLATVTLAIKVSGKRIFSSHLVMLPLNTINPQTNSVNNPQQFLSWFTQLKSGSVDGYVNLALTLEL